MADEPIRFRLSSLLLTTALIAGCLAVARIEPMLGVLLVVVGGPAYIRTALAARRSCEDLDVLMSSITQVLVFAESVVIVVLLAACMLLTFAAVLGLSLALGFWIAGAVGAAGQGLALMCLVIGLILAILSSLGVTGWLGLLLWPVRWTQRRRAEA